MSDSPNGFDALLYALGPKLHPWQLELLRAMRPGKPMVHLPQRSGKSFVAAALREFQLAEGRPVLVLTKDGLSRVRRVRFGRGTVDVHERIYSDKPDVKP